MKIAIISDIHHSREANMLGEVERFVAAATASGADLLLDLGDRIDDTTREGDLALVEELANAFRRFPGPRVHLLGNHDVVNLSSDDHERMLGRRPGHMVLELGEIRLVVWEPSVHFHRPRGFDPASAHLDWLVAALAEDSRPAIVATHIPVSGASMVGNYYFANNPSLATYPDADLVRAAVEKTGNAAVWLSGHVHWNSLATVGGIRHATFQSTSETFTTNGKPALAWGYLHVAASEAELNINGRDPLFVKFPFAPSRISPWPVPRASIAS